MRGWRVIFVLSIASIAAVGLAGRLFYVQVFSHKFYQAQALGQQAGFKEVQGRRGEIFFANSKETMGRQSEGTVKSIAINKDTWLAAALPAKITDAHVFSAQVASVLGLEQQDVLAKLNQAQGYAILKKGLLESQIEELKALALEGLSIESEPARSYPQETMAAQVVGFVGGEGTGQYGIEGHYENILQGKTGIQEEKRGLNVIYSRPLENLDGSDLYLTIDYNIQFQAEALLEEEKEKHQIDSGQIIVMKPDSGRVLAMANYPSFNVNNYGKVANLGIFQNGAAQKLFEPGSVFKPLTMAMALQEGRVSPETVYHDSGTMKIGPDTINNFNHEVYGDKTMSGILEKSINTGAAWLSQQVGRKTFLEYAEKLGLNQKTGIDVQGEVTSRNQRLKQGSEFDFATAAFGQGIEMTPIQLVRAFSVFANGGKIPQPYVVERIVHGQEQEITKPKLSGQIISEKTAGQVAGMLINVVEKGFGDGAKIPGYYIAGKTGTAQVAYENRAGYYPDKTIQSFIGFGPALDPQFLILVKLDNPKVPKSALSAVPIFKKLAQYIINYWQIPPDYEVE
jgi:cell division protein FtsI (penicillin-binding protein 3)/stage V sporulation protein D (sporulation-specific penicillin-binding protein)